MIHKWIILVYCVFEWSKHRRIVRHKMVQHCECLRSCYGRVNFDIIEIFIVVWGWKFLLLISTLPKHFRFLNISIIVDGCILSCLMMTIKFSIVFVEISFSSNWFVTIHQNIIFFSHHTIKKFHDRWFFIVFCKFFLR